MSDPRPTNVPTDPDLDLLRAASGGDVRAFEALVKRHADSLNRLALSLAHNRADADDVLQETLLGAYRGMKHFGGRSLVKTWLMHILTLQARKAWQRGRRHRATRSILATIEDGADETTRLVAPAQVDGREEELLRAVESLRPAQRDVLVLKELQGMSLREVALRLHLPRGTVESRLTRARAALRQRLRARQGHAAAAAAKRRAGGE